MTKTSGKTPQQECFSCRYFRLDSLDSGLCRVDPAVHGSYPRLSRHDRCQRWQFAGQQYYIHYGWLRAQQEKAGLSVS